MTERWKPKAGERYWVVWINAPEGMCSFYACHKNDYFMENFWSVGNCFKTEAEAQVAAEKVKALLLNLPDKDNNQASNLPDKDLPDWCKVGEYVYDPLYGYGEIVFASEKHFYVEFDGHAAEYSQENVPELKQSSPAAVYCCRAAGVGRNNN